MKKDTEERLLSKNTKPTSMRILVYEMLSSQHVGMSLSEIESHFEHADRTTIYRTLKTFEENGIVHSIQENNTTKYMLCHDACDGDHHHDLHLHFYCTECGKTTCLESVSFEKIHLPENYDFKEFKFLASGTCKDCRDLKTM